MAELITEEFLKVCPNKSHLRFAFEFYKEVNVSLPLHGEKITVE